MKKPVYLLLLVASLTSFSGAFGLEKPVRHDFVIKNFKTESGVTLPEAHVVYGTYGHLNAAHDNVILLPSHYMAKLEGYEWLMGPGPDKCLDPEKYLLVSTELFGNGSSSSPSNTPEPFHGPRFPVMTIRDNVQAVHQLLLEDVKVTHLKAIIGFSMGAEQAFQWAVTYPEMADKIVATSGTARAYGHGIMRLESQISAIAADETFKGGDYTEEPKKGLIATQAVWAAWLYSPQWWREELWRTNPRLGATQEEVIHRMANNGNRNDANDQILQMRTWQRHDIGTTPGIGGDTKKALRSIKVPVLYMPSMSDQYFPVGDARYEAQYMHTVTLLPIPSLWGHSAGRANNPADEKFLNDNIGKFLRGEPVAAEKVVPAMN